MNCLRFVNGTHVERQQKITSLTSKLAALTDLLESFQQVDAAISSSIKEEQSLASLLKELLSPWELPNEPLNTEDTSNNVIEKATEPELEELATKVLQVLRKANSVHEPQQVQVKAPAIPSQQPKPPTGKIISSKTSSISESCTSSKTTSRPTTAGSSRPIKPVNLPAQRRLVNLRLQPKPAHEKAPFQTNPNLHKPLHHVQRNKQTTSRSRTPSRSTSSGLQDSNAAKALLPPKRRSGSVHNVTENWLCAVPSPPPSYLVETNHNAGKTDIEGKTSESSSTVNPMEQLMAALTSRNTVYHAPPTVSVPSLPHREFHLQSQGHDLQVPTAWKSLVQRRRVLEKELRRRMVSPVSSSCEANFLSRLADETTLRTREVIHLSERMQHLLNLVQCMEECFTFLVPHNASEDRQLCRLHRMLEHVLAQYVALRDEYFHYVATPLSGISSSRFSKENDLVARVDQLITSGKLLLSATNAHENIAFAFQLSEPFASSAHPWPHLTVEYNSLTELQIQCEKLCQLETAWIHARVQRLLLDNVALLQEAVVKEAADRQYGRPGGSLRTLCSLLNRTAPVALMKEQFQN